MERKEFTVYSDYDKLPLRGTLYEPSGEKRGIVQICHGMCEYRERYDAFMQFLCSQGYVVACHDHRGHGDSVFQEEDRGWFNDYDARAIVDDAVQISKYLKAEYPELSLTLFGHSMGSMIVRCYIRENDDLIDKLIVCGTPAKNPLVDIAIGLEKCIRLFYGSRHRSKLLAYLSTGKGDDKFPGEGKGAWLSHNRENIEEFHTNPKGKFRFTCNGFENLFKMMKRTYTKKGYLKKNPDLKILFISGSEDAVLGGEKNWNKAVGFLKDVVGYKNVEAKVYEGQRHEILNDTKKEEVYKDVFAFLSV